MAAKSTKQRKNSKSRPNKKQQDNGLRGEIIILVLLAVCILLVLSNFGLGGIAGEAVSSVFFGLFGFMAYVLPFVIFGLAAFLVSNRGNTHAYIKIAAAVVLFLLLTAILELIFNSYTPGASILSYYRSAAEHRNAGGLTGGCVVSILCPLIGVAGTYVVLIIFSVICLILVTEKSLLAPLGKKSREAYEDVKKHREETAVIRAQKREERRRETASPVSEGRKGRRRDHKVSGVSFATTLDGGKRASGIRRTPGIYELKPEESREMAPEDTDKMSIPADRPEYFAALYALVLGGTKYQDASSVNAAKFLLKMDINVGMDGNSFVMTGASTKKDFSQMVRLAATMFADPGFREDGEESLMKYGQGFYLDYETSPMSRIKFLPVELIASPVARIPGTLKNFEKIVHPYSPAATNLSQ